MSIQPSERSAHHDAVRESTPRAPEPASLSGSQRMELYKHFDATVGARKSPAESIKPAAGAGKDANLPTHLTFDNSIYGSSIYGSNAGNDGSYKVASAGDVPPPPSSNAQARVENLGTKEAPPALNGDTRSRLGSEYMKDAGKFAYGDTMTDAEAKEGKDKLKTLTEDVFKNKGEQGLQELAAGLSKQAANKYGDSAFDKAPSEFDDSLATVKATENKDGSTQVQYNFAQPNSDKTNSVIFQIPKPELGSHEHPYFPDSGKDTYKI